MESRRTHIEAAFGQPVRTMTPLSGGCIADAYKVVLNDTTVAAIKFMETASSLQLEAKMLRYLRDHSDLPVPKVLYADEHMLAMQFLPNDAPISAANQQDAARMLAKLHSITENTFGFDHDTLIGPLPQPNPRSDKWIPFFSEHRLNYMAGLAVDAGRMNFQMQERVQAFSDNLGNWLEEPDRPGLIHGDMWTGNVLCSGNRISGFIDPAIYYADPEIELAYSTLFSTFGEPFFDAYNSIRPIKAGFFEERRDIYNLYPLLVHVRLFGGSYVASVDTTLRKFGY